MLAAFPLFGIAEAAYFVWVPFLFWCLCEPSWKKYCVTAFIANAIMWLALLMWLRHAVIIGWVLLALIVAIFGWVWLMCARKMLPVMVEKNFEMRLLGIASLAGLWVVLEWVRSWLFSGFPWLPLAASHWERPVLLQIAAFTGSYGVSFILIFFNVAFALYLNTIARGTLVGAQRSLFRVTPDLCVALGLIFMSMGLYFREQPRSEAEQLFRAAMVQPDTPALLKWEPTEHQAQLEVLKNLTAKAAEREIDFIIWPEAATSNPIVGDIGMYVWLEYLANQVKVPILLGSLAYFPRGRDAQSVEGEWYNSVFYYSHESGLFPESYCKRKCVPFGEYIPFEWLVPIVNRIVPMGDDIQCGKESKPLDLLIGGRIVRLGFLICYEDIFPLLARETVKQGAETLVVLTNNNWFGREAGAYQHAAHSVLRAVEMRRPVVRCGNAGWSGWIDSMGHVREVLTDQSGSIYFQGVGDVTVTVHPEWKNFESFYVRYGDWFVWVCVVLFLGGCVMCIRRKE